MADNQFTRIVKYLKRPLHPAWLLVALIGLTLFSVPFLYTYRTLRLHSIFLYLVYPALYLLTHLIWFWLPFIHTKARWILFWITLTLVGVLGYNFLFLDYKEAYARGINFEIFFMPVRWFESAGELSTVQSVLYSIIPSAVGTGVYTLVLNLLMKIYNRLGKDTIEREKETGQN